MQAPPSVRVTLRPSAAPPLAVTTLWCVAGACVASWLGLKVSALGWALATLGAGWFVVWAVRRHRAAPPAVLAWDGQQWFLQATPDRPAQAGWLRLQFDFDGWSLVRFEMSDRAAQHSNRNWWWATPRTVQGPWNAWRAALLQSQHRRWEDRRGPPAQPVQ